MDLPDMDKLLDELEQSPDEFLKSSTHILEDNSLLKNFQSVNSFQKVKDSEGNKQLIGNYFEPNASSQSSFRKSPVEPDQTVENVANRDSICESSPPITQKIATVNTEDPVEELCATQMQLIEQPSLIEDQLIFLDEENKNAVSDVLGGVLVEPVVEDIMAGSTSPQEAKTNSFAMTDDSKCVSIGLGATSSPRAPILTGSATQATNDCAVVEDIEPTNAKAEKLLSKALLADINKLSPDDHLPWGSGSQQLDEPSKQGSKSPETKEAEKNVHEIESEMCTEQLQNIYQTGLCDAIQLPGHQLQVKKNEEIAAEVQLNEPSEEDIFSKYELTIEKSKYVEPPEEVISEDDLYEEIEKMEKLILADKRGFPSCSTPNSPPVICIGKDSTILTSNTVDKSSLTPEERSLLSGTSQQPINGSEIRVEEGTTKRSNEADAKSRRTSEQPNAYTLDDKASSSCHQKDDGEVECSIVPKYSSQLEITSEQCIQDIKDTEKELSKMVDEKVVEVVAENEDLDSKPSTSSAIAPSQEEPSKRSVVASTHNFDISVINSQIKLTESELQLAKVKPYWIPDEECANCMLCSAKFTIVNRRHHCRSCGRVLCSGCCAVRRMLPYMEPTERKQRVCTPCNTTLDMIEVYEKNIAAERGADTTHQNNENNTRANSIDSPGTSQSETITSSVDQPSSSNNSKKGSSSIRKRSVLKVRLPTVQTLAEDGAEGEIASSAVLGGEIPSLGSSTPATTLSTAVTHDLPASLSSQPKKRAVTFRDGVNPGDSPTGGAESSREGIPDGGRLKKNTKKISKRTMEKRAEEEQVDEVLIVLESREKSSKATENDEKAAESFLEEEQQDLIEILLQLEDIFSTCLKPCEETLDDRMGIRRCCNRMNRMYVTKQGCSKLAGIEASAIYLHRPQGQLFGNLPIPTSPFFIATLLKKEEIAWAIAIPNRVLHSLGKQSSYYPIPLINARQRTAVFSSDQTQASVLKVFNDFRNWSYRIAKLSGSYVSLSDSKTEVIIPKWAIDEIKSIVETNRNMLGWALDYNELADSHLVCEQNTETGAFTTHIFSNHNTTRKITGATFVIFDGALKNSTEQFELRVVEDGLVIRMQPDTMAELIKALLVGEDFNLETANMHLEIAFRTTNQPPLHTEGALVSPIDATNLMGKYQYGLVLNRQFRSQNFIPAATEWALRLATVINMDNGKFPSILQPKFFEICEQIVSIVSHTIKPFIGVLVAAGQRTICLRIRVDEDCAIYDSEQWPLLKDERYVWASSLDEQMLPFLYSICSWVPNGLHIELHLCIISSRPLPMEVLAFGKDIGF